MCPPWWSSRSATCCKFDLIPLRTRDYARAAKLVRMYSNLPLGAADASVIAVAERLGDRDIATTNRWTLSPTG